MNNNQTTNLEDLKRKLLEEAATKPVRAFVQLDVFQNRVPTGLGEPDSDNEEMFAGWTYELNRTNEVRVLIPAGRSVPDAVRALRKVAAWLEDAPGLLEQSHWGDYANKFAIPAENPDDRYGETQRELPSNHAPDEDTEAVQWAISTLLTPPNCELTPPKPGDSGIDPSNRDVPLEPPGVYPPDWDFDPPF